MDRQSRRLRWPGYQRPIEPEVIMVVPFREDLPFFGTIPPAGMGSQAGQQAGADLPARGKIIDAWG